MKRVGIVGATGYTAGELIRHVLNHPELELAQVVSSSRSGERIDEIHPCLSGVTSLETADFDGQSLAKLDAVFLAVPHGRGAEMVAMLEEHHPRLIIDLSRDHRHVAGWLYGLAEFQSEHFSESNRIAVPGCFATAIQIACAPLCKKRLVSGPIQVVAATGSTGLGTNPSKSGHHPERFANLKAYKILTHQHVSEVESMLREIGGETTEVRMVPISAPVDRGILATCIIPLKELKARAELIHLYKEFYGENSGVRLREQSPEIRWVRGTSWVDVAVFSQGDHAYVIGALDNLGKGASGQAIQCLNLHFGWSMMKGLPTIAALP
ncbi:MAG: N-acetyl-gamma-glutamyl-phosphate reductase [Myxococcota bacterium]|nr:N-acetyl-gamma-glutamyl-phosphate reductase [Myxococcota bacterium]